MPARIATIHAALLSTTAALLAALLLALAPTTAGAQPPEPEPGPVLGRAAVGQAIAIAAHHLTQGERRRLCWRTINTACQWPRNERPWALVTGFSDRETRIDPRIRNDAIAIGRKYRVAYWDCLGGHPPHIINGEHPIGVACDIVPDRSRRGTWGLVQKLARDYGWRPSCAAGGCYGRGPFRIILYNGYPGHGDPAHTRDAPHLHISWQHASAAPFTRPAWVVNRFGNTVRRFPD